MTILISFFFFQFQEKKKIGFYKPNCFFSICISFYCQHSHPYSPHSDPHSQHFHPDSPHSHPDSPHSYLDSPHFHPDSPRSHHSPHSVPRFPIPAFTDICLFIYLFYLNLYLLLVQMIAKANKFQQNHTIKELQKVSYSKKLLLHTPR